MAPLGVLISGLLLLAPALGLADVLDGGMPRPLACLTQWYPATAQQDDAGWWLVLPTGERFPYDDHLAKTAEERLEHPDVADLFAAPYPSGPIAPIPLDGADPGRVRLEPLMRATYGASPEAVEKELVHWHLLGTTIRVHRRARAAFDRVSARLEALVKAHPELGQFLVPNGGSVAFRNIAGTDRSSAHAFGIAFDLNPALGDYWRNRTPPSWSNRVPAELVEAFEAEGFIWGGRWAHYDTMHFEWRPELACARGSPTPAETLARPRYPWLGEAGVPPTSADLASRFPSPAGFARVQLSGDSFGYFLRHLPLAPPGTPIVAFDGSLLYDQGTHPNVAAIVAIDVGRADLQQCADSVIRMDAEWRWSRGKRDAAYRAASGETLSFGRFAEGYRVKASGSKLVESRPAGPAPPSRALYRRWLDSVFAWANTASLAREGVEVGGLDRLRPGDFMVMEGKPFGHAVLVLDVARSLEPARAGTVAVLLGQGYLPAQSFQVLQPTGGDSAWFFLDSDARAISTPFWVPFPLQSLRRFR